MDSEDFKKHQQEEREKKLKIVVVILITVLSFLLGYLFASQTSVAPIIIEKCGE